MKKHDFGNRDSKNQNQTDIVGNALVGIFVCFSLAEVWVFGLKNQYALSASVVSEVATLGQLVHELQAERGMTAACHCVQGDGGSDQPNCGRCPKSDPCHQSSRGRSEAIQSGVADEVSKLAVSSAASSQEIALLVQAASGETAKAVSAVNEVSRDMVTVGEMSKLTDSLLQRIAPSLEQQASAVEEINANLSGLNHIANSNAAASEEMTASVITLSSSADATRQEVAASNFEGPEQ